jgi:subtilisin family serine protease
MKPKPALGLDRKVPHCGIVRRRKCHRLRNSALKQPHAPSPSSHTRGAVLLAVAPILAVLGLGGAIAEAQTRGVRDHAIPVPPGNPNSPAALSAKAGPGKLRIIFIASAAAVDGRGAATVPAAFDLPEGDIQRTQQRLMAGIKTAGGEDIRPVTGLPMATATVSAEQIRSLAEGGLVGAMEEERLLKPVLAQSVPLINAPQVWGNTGSNKGQGQIVVILDTGVRSNHTFLAGRLAKEACFSYNGVVSGITLTSLCPGAATSSYAPGSGEACTNSATLCTHGTHVAGIAVGKQNPSAAYDGVAPAAKYISVQIYSKSGGNIYSISSDLYAAMQWVRIRKLAGDPIASVNLSSGGIEPTPPANPCSGPMVNLVQLLRAANVATVISAGNSSWANAVGWPACTLSAFTVGNSTKTDTISSTSNAGALIDVFAPGHAILSAGSASPTTYFVAGGTSMAAPHVAGAFALLRQRFQCYPIAEFENALKNTGVVITHPTTGATYRRINLQAAVAVLAPKWKTYPCARLMDTGPGATNPL